jgi:hypothetical protein
MIFSHKGLKVGSGNVLWATLMGAPLHKEADGEAAKHAQDPHAILILHPASVVVVGDVQALVQTAFDAPSLPVEQQPEHRWQERDRSTGD